MSEYSLSDIATASRENGFGGDTERLLASATVAPQVSQLLKQACATP